MRTSLSCLMLVTLLSLGPLRAEQAPAEDDAGTSLMEEGARMLFRGLMQEMEPALDDMGRALKDMEPSLRAMGPRLRELVSLMGDVTNYEAPERLSNGDILIRRKPGAPPPPSITPDSAPGRAPDPAPRIETPPAEIDL